MTMTPSSIVTTTRIRRGANTALSISYVSTDSATLMQACPPKLRSLIDQAIEQWWNGLAPSLRFALGEQSLNFMISARLLHPPESTTAYSPEAK
jgi:hypothetical protein